MKGIFESNNPIIIANLPKTMRGANTYDFFIPEFYNEILHNVVDTKYPPE
jgi:hypothetical protein